MESRLAHLTEAAIQDTFLKLLSEQPFDKITVTQLVEECQITRRTFYYHYSDLFELLDIILRRETDRAVAEFEATGSWEECMITASRFAREHKRAVYHIYTSSHRPELERHVDRVSEEMMRSYVERQAKGLRVSEQDKKLVCDLYRFGITDLPPTASCRACLWECPDIPPPLPLTWGHGCPPPLRCSHCAAQ